ncbi:hypothetical protein KY360_06830, partial [Candidatus Woesearchaeota archaeon]|nr:hypothetical protein [Candidatus Woesearchaeota archaeon]
VFLMTDKDPDKRQYCAELGKHITAAEFYGTIIAYIDGSKQTWGRFFLRQYLSHAFSKIYGNKPEKSK